MKYPLLILGLAFALGCKKDSDSDSTPTPNPNPNPTGKTCRLKSATKGGKKIIEISYDSLGRISKWVDDNGFSSGKVTFTFQYQTGGNKVFIGGINSNPSELAEGTLNSAGYITLLKTKTSGFTSYDTIQYDSENRIIRKGVTYTGNDFAKIEQFNDSARVIRRVVFEYANNTVYKILPPNLSRQYLYTAYPFITGNLTNRKFPSRVSFMEEYIFGDVQNFTSEPLIQDQANGLIRLANDITYEYENCD